MKVLFTENIKNVAQMGDIKEVAPGYARNFLFLKNMAVPATESAVAQAEELKKKRFELEAKTKKQAEELVKALESVELSIETEANESGNLYGSVGAEEVARELEVKSFKVNPDHINLAEPIKKTGKYEVEIEPHPELKVKIKVNVVRSEPTNAAE